MSDFYAQPIAAALLQWYAAHARNLPWRQTRDPYCIWVSEIMLQQTRVEAVRPFYARFLHALPDIASLASCEEERLLKLWEGLGYYSRVRNMQRTARILCENHNGRMPATTEELLQLPGIGPYTAGAIASIAFGVATPAVDGNVLRVLARLCNSSADIALPQTRKDAEAVLREMIPSHAPGAFNQALMELGACICLPNAAPLCGQCPIASLCEGLRRATAQDLPYKSKKAPRRIETHTVFLLRYGGAIAVRKRGPQGLLRGLWELPNVPGFLEDTAMAAQLSQWCLQPGGTIACYTAKHIFTHIEWHMRVYAMDLQSTPLAEVRLPEVRLPEVRLPEVRLPEGWQWASDESMHALPTAFRTCIKSLPSQ